MVELSQLIEINKTVVELASTLKCPIKELPKVAKSLDAQAQIVEQLAKAFNCSPESVPAECEKIINRLNQRIKVNLAIDLIPFIQEQARLNGNRTPAQWVNDLIRNYRITKMQSTSRQ